MLSFAAVGNAAGTKTMNKFNVVLVTDASGSMKQTDPNQYRFEAIDLFVGLISNGGNYVGSVVFGDGVESEYPIGEVKNKADKTAVTDDIKNQNSDGWTDIGGALTSAVNMLDTKGNKNIPSIIILLTDGNTEMSTPELTEKSIKNKENALEKARDKGYTVYSICLNTNNRANTAELKQIAAATGGQFKEVSNAADLQDVFDLYYQMIYSTRSDEIMNESVPATGVLSREFNVADVGVEEVNVVIFGDVDKCTITPPSGTPYTDAQTDDISYISNTFRILKIVSPDPGIWKIDTYAAPNTTIKVFKIYNPNLQVKVEYTKQDSYAKGKEIKFLTQIYESDKKVTDMARYAGYKATMNVKDYDGNDVKTAEAASPAADGFELSFTPSDYGTYYVHIGVSSSEMSASAEEIILQVGNTPPVAKTDVLKKHINIWPFIIKTDSTIDLSEAATDAEDDKLTYKVVSSTWLEDDYTLDGSNLTIDNFSVSKGSFEIQAIDSQGAYCSFDVKVTSTNIGILTMILLLVGGLIVLIVMFILFKIASGKAFMGQLTAENLETGAVGAPMKNRGQLKLGAFQIGNTGFDKNSYFQATGKNYVYFISKKPFTSDGAFGKIKKMKIETSQDYRIFSDAEQTKGISVRFESMLNNRF